METNKIKRPLGWTTLEEAQKLVEAGLNPETADMYYVFKRADCRESLQESVPVGPFPMEGTVDVSLSDRVEPCWSLGKLLELLPFRLNLNKPVDNQTQAFREIDDNVVAYVVHGWDNTDLVWDQSDNLVKPAVSVLMWLLKEGYLNPKP